MNGFVIFCSFHGRLQLSCIFVHCKLMTDPITELRLGLIHDVFTQLVSLHDIICSQSDSNMICWIQNAPILKVVVRWYNVFFSACAYA